jgi:hypothetical protein
MKKDRIGYNEGPICLLLTYQAFFTRIGMNRILKSY